DSSEGVQFEYKLDGFDEDWINAGGQRTASYSQLPAGKYHFRVKACGADGHWNELKVSLPVQVDPFIWQTWWFRLLVGTVFLLIIISLVRYVSVRRFKERVKTLEQQAALERERTRIARDI